MPNFTKLKFKSKKSVMNFLKLNPEYALKLSEGVINTEYVYFDMNASEHMYYVKLDNHEFREPLKSALDDYAYPSRFGTVPIDTIDKKQESES